MRKVFSVLLALSFCVGVSAQGVLKIKYQKGRTPREIGVLLTKRYIQSPFTDFGLKLPATHITYPEVCAWYGALKFSAAVGNKSFLRSLEERYYPLEGEKKRLVPSPGHVDATVFGVIPLQIYTFNKNETMRELGIAYADAQWTMPENTKRAEQYQLLLDQGLSWQTRYWIDDMFMISAIQMQAYRITGDRKYADRSAHEMLAYLDKIQQPNGLFFHAENAPFFWGRGNGWMAAGMTELLKDLPADTKGYDEIMEAYRLMMKTLKENQSECGMWRQLVDNASSYKETSCTGMFTYAMIVGVKKGWLPAEEYLPLVEKSWNALVGYITYEGAVSEVCEGTNTDKNKTHYLNRRRITGDLHGQAPVLWCATELILKQ